MGKGSNQVSASGRDKASSAIWVAVNQVDLPEKKYFKIGEVAHLVGVEPHVLRYWQTQFPQVRPQKSRSGHRLYRREDVETLLAIKELLHVQRFTIAGARQALKNAVVHRGDTTRPPMDAAPAVPEPSAKAEQAEQAELMLVGVDGAGLSQALDQQLAEQQAGREIAQVDAYGVTEPASRLPSSVAPPVAVATRSAAAQHPATPSATGTRTSAEGTPRAQVPVENVDDVAAGQDDVAGRLNFPLIGADREALQQARDEVQSLISLLESEEAKDRDRPFFARTSG